MSQLTQVTTKQLFGQVSVQQRFEQLLGNKAPGFITSVLQAVQNNGLLSKADPNTVLNAAATAAALDLPIQHSLGFAYIVPYKGQAQFQLGYRGLVQLALRSGQYKNINVIAVFENQYKGFNALTEELDADFTIEGKGAVAGYVAYMKLNNGFCKTVFWSLAKVTEHAKQYSQSYNHKNSIWKNQFEAMAKKTVLKSMLSKWGIMTVEMQTAQLADQAVIEQPDQYRYADNVVDIEADNLEEETNRVLAFIEKATTQEELDLIETSYPEANEGVTLAIKNKRETLKK